jgi:homoserine dehydrogenase
LAQVSAQLGAAGVSIDRMRQYGHQGDLAPVLIVTHSVEPTALAKAVASLSETGVVEGEPVALRIEDI